MFQLHAAVQHFFAHMHQQLGIKPMDVRVKLGLMLPLWLKTNYCMRHEIELPLIDDFILLYVKKCRVKNAPSIGECFRVYFFCLLQLAMLLLVVWIYLNLFSWSKKNILIRFKSKWNYQCVKTISSAILFKHSYWRFINKYIYKQFHSSSGIFQPSCFPFSYSRPISVNIFPFSTISK